MRGIISGLRFLEHKNADQVIVKEYNIFIAFMCNKWHLKKNSNTETLEHIHVLDLIVFVCWKPHRQRQGTLHWLIWVDAVTYNWFPTRTCQYQCLLLASDDPVAVIIFYLYDLYILWWGLGEKILFVCLWKWLKKWMIEVQDIFLAFNPLISSDDSHRFIFMPTIIGKWPYSFTAV